MGAFMGMAGLHGMLRRTLYINGEFMPYMVLAGISGALLLIAFVAFLYNIIMTVGINGVLGIFKSPKHYTEDLLPKS
jgi:cytochrome c oxidase subunit 1